jgi:hypothetical protein
MKNSKGAASDTFANNVILFLHNLFLSVLFFRLFFEKINLTPSEKFQRAAATRPQVEFVCFQ